MKKILIIGILVFSCTGIFLLFNYFQKLINPTIDVEFLTLVNQHPHDPTVFTQGLFFYNDELYETSGLYEKSRIFKNVDLTTGKPERSKGLMDNVFAEGAVVLNDKLYVLTWKEHRVMMFEPENLELLDEIPYQREGWGLTTDGEHLIASDGSATIYFMDEKLNDVRQIVAELDGVKIDGLNELEYVKGDIWANLYPTEEIAIIDGETGTIKRVLNFAKLYPGRADANQVLNGIAYDGENIFLTGKNWETLYEFSFTE